MYKKCSYIASLVLFFYNRISGNYLISKTNMDKICDMFINDKDLNIDYSNSDINYIFSVDEDNNEYLILKNDYDYKKWESIILSMPLEFYRIIMSDDVLNILNIKLSNVNKFNKYVKSV